MTAIVRWFARDLAVTPRQLLIAALLAPAFLGAVVAVCAVVAIVGEMTHP